MSDARELALDNTNMRLKMRLADTERQLREAQERCERLEVVLRFYANMDNYHLVPTEPDYSHTDYTSKVCSDNGFRARAALGPEPDEQAMQEGKV